MTEATPYRSGIRAIPFAILGAALLACSLGGSAFAQHPGGHFGGTPHVSVPPATHAPLSRPVLPVRPPLTSPGARGSFVRPPVIRVPSAPPFVAGYPFSRFPVLPHRRFRPAPPFPIVPPVGFGLFGIPFFGLGFGWPDCSQFLIWGYTCNGLPLYEYGAGYSPVPIEPSYQQPQMEIETWPVYYGTENPVHPELHLKDGTVYSVTDYWLVDGELHFKVIEGFGPTVVEHTINFDQLDLQKTIDVNTARGFRFVLRNAPIEQYLKDHPSLDEPSERPIELAPPGPIAPVPPPPQN